MWMVAVSDRNEVLQSLYGPFETPEAAEEWADKDFARRDRFHYTPSYRWQYDAVQVQEP